MRIVNRTGRKQTINGISINPNEEYVNHPTVVEPSAIESSAAEPQPEPAIFLNPETASEDDVRAVQASNELETLRSEYISLTGKRFYHGWDAEELKKRIEAAKEG